MTASTTGAAHQTRHFPRLRRHASTAWNIIYYWTDTLYMMLWTSTVILIQIGLHAPKYIGPSQEYVYDLPVGRLHTNLNSNQQLHSPPMKQSSWMHKILAKSSSLCAAYFGTLGFPRQQLPFFTKTTALALQWQWHKNPHLGPGTWTLNTTSSSTGWNGTYSNSSESILPWTLQTTSPNSWDVHYSTGMLIAFLIKSRQHTVAHLTDSARVSTSIPQPILRYRNRHAVHYQINLLQLQPTYGRHGPKSLDLYCNLLTIWDHFIHWTLGSFVS